ncbi:MAG: transcription factor TFIIE [Desulfurococcaceae archaeon]
MSSKKTHGDATEGSTLEDDLITIAKEIIRKTYGDVASKLFEYLLENEYIAEEKIVNNVEVRSNEARKILQKLSDEAIVTPDKVRDGSEILHVWRLNKLALRTFIINRLKKTREKLESLLKYENEGVIYECKTCKRRFLVDEAYANGFQCPHDNDILVEVNNPTTSSNLRDLIKRIDNIISKIERS